MAHDPVQLSVIDEEEIDTILGSEIDFEGEILSSESLMIKGKVRGSIRCTAELYIAEQAVVQASIEAPKVIVRGTVRGDITASSLIAILDWAHVEGNLRAPDIYRSPECFFQGSQEIVQ
ncbi:MAG: polymer-forming cytoskeletal protein [Rectinemataceae bacterium]|nr:polymer-forming cytoskeletal protein [Spirochaetaceae bacterium]